MRAVRALCNPALGERLAQHVLAALPPGRIVGGFWPLSGEIDIRGLLAALAARRDVVALPVTPALGEALTFHRWRPGAALHPGRFGTMQPASDPVTPAVLLVPLLAFDRRGGRLGYGGGYYDRTLAALPGAYAIGCAFAALEVPAVPLEPHDRPLDAIATESGVIVAARGTE